MNRHETTIGLLYPGEMGAAVASILRGGEATVVTTLAHRGDRTADRCAETGIEVLDALADVARRAQVVISLVPPANALEVAEAYGALIPLAPPGAIYIDANSIGPQSAAAIADVITRAGGRFVDAAINGLAENLPTGGTLFLSGDAANEVAALFADLVRVRVVTCASTIKMLLGGMSKGLCGLFLELALVAERRGMLGEMLDAAGEIYPGMQAVVDRMLPTYAQHSGRRATEMCELRATAEGSGVEPCVIEGIAQLHEQLAHTNFTAASGADVQSIVRAVGSGQQAVGSGIFCLLPTAYCLLWRDNVMANKPRSAHLHPGPGFRVRVNFERPSAEMMRAFAHFPTPDISDLLNRLYAVDPEIHCLTSAHHRICGPACTVKVFPGDNLMVHKSLDVIEAGDVIIVDAGGSTMNAVLGDLVSTKAKHRGAAGFVIDGLVRDLPGIAELNFPVFARGTSPIGPLHRGPGEINFAICCGGIVVNPGDIIVGDAMGVVVIPQTIAAELLERLQEHSATNATYLDAVRKGNFSNAWVDNILTEMECPMIKGCPPSGVLPSAADALEVVKAK